MVVVLAQHKKRPHFLRLSNQFGVLSITDFCLGGITIFGHGEEREVVIQDLDESILNKHTQSLSSAIFGSLLQPE